MGESPLSGLGTGPEKTQGEHREHIGKIKPQQKSTEEDKFVLTSYVKLKKSKKEKRRVEKKTVREEFA